MTRHPDSDRLGRALRKCLAHAIAWSGNLFHSASPRYANKDDLLTGAGSKTAGARWNPPNSFRTVYTSLDVETAVTEALAHFRHYGFSVAKALPRVIVSLEAKYRRLLDLTDGTARRIMGVSERRMLTEPWRELQAKGREALTQAIGRLAYAADLEGLLVSSAAHRGGVNVILSPANLDAPGSWLRIINKADLPAPPNRSCSFACNSACFSTGVCR
jgi:RES domain-containing protein